MSGGPVLLLWHQVRILSVPALCLLVCACNNGPRESPREAAPRQAVDVPAPVPPITAADPRPAIVAVGDSITAAFGLDPGNSFTDFLQRELDSGGKRYRVVNAGISGDTT